MSRQVRFAAENIEHKIEDDEYSDEPSGDEESGNNKKRQFNKFELLDLIEGDGEIQAGSDDETLSDIEEGKDKQDGCKRNVVPENNVKSQNKRKPRKNKRGKNKSSKGSKSNTDETGEDELANLARAISQKSEPSELEQAANLKYKLLKVDSRNLVPETEIKRIFGKSVVKEDKSKPKLHPGLNLQRSRFVSSGYFETKSSGSLPGIKMELDDTINNLRKGYTTGGRTTGLVSSGSTLFNSTESIYFKFVHDDAYQDAQRLFLDAVHRGNSEFIVQNIQAMPTHAESHIQLSHMLRVSEDYKTASEFIERALVIFEKGFHPRFNLATATCRLSYKRPENRTFFITIFKHISACHRRGLRRTPFEYSKLLLSLEPENDPLMAVQLIDFFAIRSEEYDYLIDFYSLWDQLQKLPNLSFSLAMAHFHKSRNTKRPKAENEASLKLADERIQRALLLFPNFIIPLLDACSGEPNSELKKCKYFDYSVYGTNYKLVPEVVDVLVALYVKRTYSLWKQKHVLAWLERNIAEMVGKFTTGELEDEGMQTQHWSKFTTVAPIAPKNLLRHIVLCDLDMKTPPSASSSTYIDLDPYPPTDPIISYNTSTTSIGNRANSSGGGGGSLLNTVSGLFLRSILPSFSLIDHESDSPVAHPTTSGARASNHRNRPPQRSVTRNSVGSQTGHAAASRAGTDDDAAAVYLDEDSVEYSLLIEALRDLPSLGPNSTQETTRRTTTQDEQPQQQSGGSPNHDDNDDGAELRRRQTRPS